MNKRLIGARKEQLVTEYLIDNNYVILERNYQTKTGEIDIIAKDDKCIVFIEVKYRSSSRYGSSLDAVDYKKQHTIRHVARIYLSTRYRSLDIPCRFDVIGIDGNNITHIKNAF